MIFNEIFTMRLFLLIITLLWFCFASLYCFFNFSMTSMATAVGGLFAFIGAIIGYRQNYKKIEPQQSQNLKNQSLGLQVGRDFNFNSNKED